MNYFLSRDWQVAPQKSSFCDAKTRALSSAAAVVTACLLAACGGGGGETGVSGSMQTAQSAPRMEIDGNPEDVHFDEIRDDNLVHRLNLPGWNYCKTGAFFSLASLSSADSCSTNANLLDVYGPAPVGYVVPVAVPRCLQVPIGSGLVSLTPLAGPTSALADRRGHKMSCYQFVVASSAVVPLNVSLPSGVVGVAEVAYISTNGTFLKAAGVEGSGILSMSPTLNPARYVLIVRTENTAGGEPMGIGIGVSAPAANQSSLTQTAISSRLGEYANGVTATPGVSTAYTFFPQRDGLVKQNLTATFTANQSVKYQVMQQTGPTTFLSYGAVTTLTSSQSGQKLAVLPTNPSNSTSTTTPYGLMVTVTSTNASAPANEPFKVRVATADNVLSAAAISNTEVTSGYYPIQITAPTQVVNYVDFAAFVRDTVGFGVPRERIDVAVKQNRESSYVQSVTYEADMTGSGAKRFNFTACSGAETSYGSYGPIGTPADRWSGSHQIGELTITLPHALPPVTKTFSFTRICRETYLGRR